MIETDDLTEALDHAAGRRLEALRKHSGALSGAPAERLLTETFEEDLAASSLTLAEVLVAPVRQRRLDEDAGLLRRAGSRGDVSRPRHLRH